MIDEEFDEEDVNLSEVQLGIISKKKNNLFQDPDWNNWDGGIVGGRPVRVLHS